MKTLALRASMLLALTFTLAGAACDQAPDDATSDQPALAPPATVESQQQNLSSNDACFEVNRTIAIPAGPGHPINICKIDYVCFSQDANGNWVFTNKSLLRVC